MREDAIYHMSLPAKKPNTSAGMSPGFRIDHTTPSTYGDVLLFESGQEAPEYSQTRLCISPAMGLYPLRVQCRILRFLTNCCKEIVQCQGYTNPLQEAYPSKPKLQTLYQEEIIVAFSDYVNRAPYRPSTSLTLEPLEGLVRQNGYPVSTTLFHIPSDKEEVPSKIKWGCSVGALTSLGLSAQQLHGSQ